ncbi:Transcription initiation protein SPT3 [Blattella germanica]|nr:Transcription initiation protein SPT3 [Blattella germanica]
MSNINTLEGSVVPEQPTTPKVSFVTEIQSMMHGFGDARRPLLESATLVENVVQQQLRTIIAKAADVSSMRGAKQIMPEDIVFLMRKDRVKLNRMLKYLNVKEMKSCVTGSLAETPVDEIPDGILDGSSGPPKKRSRTCIEFLKSIDQTGELSDLSSVSDTIKHERNVRADWMSRNMDEKRYLEFVNSRRASFTGPKSGPKFREWLKIKSEDSSDNVKIHSTTYDLLVAQLVDLALLVRRDNMRLTGDPFSRYMPGLGHSTTSNQDPKQVETASALTTTEFREAIRRHQSSPVGHANLFTRNSGPRMYAPLLSC